MPPAVAMQNTECQVVQKIQGSLNLSLMGSSIPSPEPVVSPITAIFKSGRNVQTSELVLDNAQADLEQDYHQEAVALHLDI